MAAACRRLIDPHLCAWSRLARTLRAADDGRQAAPAALAPSYLAALVVVVEYAFVDRTPDLEGADGNPLNDVRAIADSVIRADGVMTVSPALARRPETSVLGLAAGDPIARSEADCPHFADAFFTQLEATYVAREARRMPRAKPLRPEYDSVAPALRIAHGARRSAHRPAPGGPRHDIRRHG